MTQEEKNTSLTIEEIIEQMFDFSGYSEEEKQKLIDEASDLILESALIRALGEAGETTQQAFDELMSKNPSPEELSKFIADYLPDFDDYLAEELINFHKAGLESEKTENGKGEVSDSAQATSTQAQTGTQEGNQERAEEKVEEKEA